jgi:hypothetical protein
MKTMPICLTLFVFLAFPFPCLAAGGDPAEAPRDAEKALGQKIKYPEIKGTLKEALAQIQELGGVPVKADWPAIGGAGVSPESPVAMSRGEARLDQLLELTLAKVSRKGYPLSWFVDGKTIRVTTQMNVLYRQRFAAVAAQQQTVGTARTAEDEELKLDAMPLGDVLERFRQGSNLNMHVSWKALEAVGVTAATPVTLQASNLTLGHALDLVMDDVSGGRDKFESVYYVIDDGVIEISTGAALNKRLKTRSFDVSDLLMPVPNFAGPRISLSNPNSASNNNNSSNQGSSGIFQQDTDTNRTREIAGEDREKIAETLTDIVKGAIGEDMWQPQGQGSIKILRGRLIISQSLLGWKLLERSGSR